MSRHHLPTPAVFCVMRGQDDNIGDAVLRRRMLEALRRTGPVHVDVGASSDEFLAGLGLGPADQVHRRRGPWLTAAEAAMRDGSVLLALKPGELRAHAATQQRRELAELVALARHLGCPVVQAGVGLRDWDEAQRADLEDLIAPLDLLIWRDTSSALWARSGFVAPDWAFGHGVPGAWEDGERRLLAITLRGDGPAPTPAWIDALGRLADRHGLEPIVVTQVRRDGPGNAELAARLGCPCAPWPDATPMVEHEAAVRRVYRAAAAVVSDRLHALIIGATEGAVPLGLLMGPDRKIERHLRAAGIRDASADLRGRSTAQVVAMAESVLARRDAIARATGIARNAVATMERRITALTAPDELLTARDEVLS